MSNLFKSVSVKKPKRSVFDLSHEKKLSCQMGHLVPILCQEVVPGDSFRLNSELLVRLAPLVSPMYHRVNVYTHFFFVPNRIIWNEWESFITGGVTGTENPVMPHIHNFSDYVSNFNQGSLADYLGYPVISSTVPSAYTIDVSSLPFRAYQKIYNDYYRDPNLHEPVDFYEGSGLEPATGISALTKLRTRCWEKDYFTSALPWTQRGGDVMLPITGDANVYLDRTVNTGVGILNPDGSEPASNYNLKTLGQPGFTGISRDFDSAPLKIDPRNTLKADMGTVTSSTINDLRKAIRLQEWLEKNARGGYRYIEQIMSHFGVKSSDSRLQRPEYLGGGKSPVVISEVLQTSSTDSETPQGNMAGHGISVGNTHSFKKFFEEHGFVIGIMSVLPRTAYQQGLPRQFTKFDRFDYYWPEFAHLGEQAILNKEIYTDYTYARQPNEVWGYTPRYAEYKYVPSTVHGEFKTSLSNWHMGRVFNPAPGTVPPLNGDFVTSDPTTRVFAVTDPTVEKLYVHIYNNLQAIRPMPKFGTPYL